MQPTAQGMGSHSGDEQAPKGRKKLQAGPCRFGLIELLCRVQDEMLLHPKNQSS
jgi:hypothetical protein